MTTDDFINLMQVSYDVECTIFSGDVRVKSTLPNVEGTTLANKAIDTLRFSRWALPENEHWTLQFLARQFSIDVKNAHRAEDDARVCMEVFFKCIESSIDRQKSTIPE